MLLGCKLIVVNAGKVAFMFTKRILGFMIGLVVTTSPWAAVQAQDGVLPEDRPAEVVSMWESRT